jgi:hypothetical protein
MREGTDEVKPLFGPPVQIFRCVSDDAIVTGSQESLARHKGHRMRQPVILKNSEWIILKLGILK